MNEDTVSPYKHPFARRLAARQVRSRFDKMKHRLASTAMATAMMSAVAVPAPAGLVDGLTYVAQGGILVPGKGVMPGHFDVERYGAKPDFDYHDGTGTDNADAFEKALAAAAAYSGLTIFPNVGPRHQATKIIANGHFLLSRGIELKQGVIIEGNGCGEPEIGGNRSSPGTWLIFPTDVNGIKIENGYDVEGSGERSQVRNLTIWCGDSRGTPMFENTGAIPSNGHTGYGIWIQGPCVIENVVIENFAEDGIFIDGTARVANPSGTRIINVSSGGHGRHGFRTLSNDANLIKFESCSSVVNWGWGVYEGGINNCYDTVHCEGNLGEVGNVGTEGCFSVDHKNHDYWTSGGGINNSLFLSCYTEVAVNHFMYPAMVLGGLAAQAPNDGDGYLNYGGFVDNIETYFRQMKGPVPVQCVLGGRSAGTVFALNVIPTNESNYWEYDSADGWWDFRNTPSSRTMRIPTSRTAQTRAQAPHYPNGIFLGDVGNKIRLFAFDGEEAPSLEPSGRGQTYEIGDTGLVVRPTPGSRSAIRCIAPGTKGSPYYPVTATTTAGSREVVVNDASWLRNDQYLLIEGLMGTRKIVSIAGSVVTVDVEADADVTDSALSFAPPVFEDVINPV